MDTEAANKFAGPLLLLNLYLVRSIGDDLESVFIHSNFSDYTDIHFFVVV